MSDRPKAVSMARGDQLRAEWRIIRKAWLRSFAQMAGFPEDHLPYITDEERRYVQWRRLAV